MIRTRGLSYSPTNRGAPPLRFADVDLRQGGTLLVCGSPGSGKSTWLALVAGLRGASGGDLLVAGTALGHQRGAEYDAWRARHLGFVPQKRHLIHTLCVADNLAFVYWAAGLARDDDAIARTLELAGVAHLARHKPHQICAEQAQRVAVARAVLLAPEVLLADEPTAQLDAHAATDVLALLQNAASACGASLVIATHDARVTQALPGVQQLNLDQTGPKRLADKREQL